MSCNQYGKSFTPYLFPIQEILNPFGSERAGFKCVFLKDALYYSLLSRHLSLTVPPHYVPLSGDNSLIAVLCFHSNDFIQNQMKIVISNLETLCIPSAFVSHYYSMRLTSYKRAGCYLSRWFLPKFLRVVLPPPYIPKSQFFWSPLSLHLIIKD